MDAQRLADQVAALLPDGMHTYIVPTPGEDFVAVLVADTSDIATVVLDSEGAVTVEGLEDQPTEHATVQDAVASITMVTVECNCRHCKAYAARKGLAFPMRARVNPKMHAAVCGTASGRHNMVQKAYQPPFGRMDAMQAKFGPFPTEQA